MNRNNPGQQVRNRRCDRGKRKAGRGLNFAPLAGQRNRPKSVIDSF